jgi:hypothetical protein
MTRHAMAKKATASFAIGVALTLRPSSRDMTYDRLDATIRHGRFVHGASYRV